MCSDDEGFRRSTFDLCIGCHMSELNEYCLFEVNNLIICMEKEGDVIE